MLLYGKRVKQWIFQKNIVVYDSKVGRCSQLNEYMHLYEYQRSRSYIDLGPRSHINLGPRSLRFNIFKGQGSGSRLSGPVKSQNFKHDG